MTITTEELAEMRKALEGVTSGPWHVDGHCMSSVLRCVVPRGHPEAKHLCGDYERIAEATSANWKADAAHIAYYSPVVIARLLDHIEQLQDELSEELRAVRITIGDGE